LTKKGGSKALKDQYRLQLWLTIAANAALFYLLSQSNTFAIAGFTGVLTGAVNLIPIGFAIIVTTVANGLLDVPTKTRLVFLRWKHALPGHRAFSVHGPSDPRVDMARLKRAVGNKMPTDPNQQNQVWYRCYKEMEDDPPILHVHREYLFLRDYTALSALFFFTFGAASLYFFQSWIIALYYCLGLVLQFLIVRRAAAVYGIRFVTTVLARKAA
jgi:hypothetical protein